jgi:cytochrome c2
MIGRVVIGVIITLIMLTSWIGCRKSNINENRSPGEKTFRSYCQSCHILPKPTDKTDEEWPIIVERYGARAKLSKEQINQILGYLTANN